VINKTGRDISMKKPAAKKWLTSEYKSSQSFDSFWVAACGQKG
jgi:hypothetical protein